MQYQLAKDALSGNAVFETNQTTSHSAYTNKIINKATVDLLADKFEEIYPSAEFRYNERRDSYDIGGGLGGAGISYHKDTNIALWNMFSAPHGGTVIQMAALKLFDVTTGLTKEQFDAAVKLAAEWVKDLPDEPTKKVGGDNTNQNSASAKSRNRKKAASSFEGSIMQERWETQMTVEPHPYLEKKGIAESPCLADNIRVGVNLLGNKALYVRAVDNEFVTKNLLYISPDGSFKQWLPNIPNKGLFTPILGTKKTLYLCEGYATACSIALSTNDTVYCCHAASNIKNVLENIPETTKNEYDNIVVAVDNDWTLTKRGKKRPFNAGVQQAIQIAAEHKDVRVTWPEFENSSDGTDFNDLHQEAGTEEVCRQLLIDRRADNSHYERATENISPKRESKLQFPDDATYLYTDTYVSDLNVPVETPCTIFLLSDTGTGKTEFIRNYFATYNSALAINPRVALAQQQATRFGCACYSDDDLANNKTIPDKMTIVINSTVRNICNRTYDLLALDEIGQLFDHITHGSYGKDKDGDRQRTYRKMRTLYRNSKIAIVAEAQMSQNSIDQILAWQPDRKIIVVDSGFRKWAGREVVLAKSKAAVMAGLIDHLENGGKAIIPLHGFHTAKETHEMLQRMFPDKKGVFFNRASAAENREYLLPENYKTLDWFIYNPVIGTGLSLDEFHFTKMFCVMSGVLTADGNHQLISRYRHAVPILAYIQAGSTGDKRYTVEAEYKRHAGLRLASLMMDSAFIEAHQTLRACQDTVEERRSELLFVERTFQDGDLDFNAMYILNTVVNKQHLAVTKAEFKQLYIRLGCIVIDNIELAEFDKKILQQHREESRDGLIKDIIEAEAITPERYKELSASTKSANNYREYYEMRRFETARDWIDVDEETTDLTLRNEAAKVRKLLFAEKNEDDKEQFLDNLEQRKTLAECGRYHMLANIINTELFAAIGLDKHNLPEGNVLEFDRLSCLKNERLMEALTKYRHAINNLDGFPDIKDKHIFTSNETGLARPDVWLSRWLSKFGFMSRTGTRRRIKRDELEEVFKSAKFLTTCSEELASFEHKNEFLSPYVITMCDKFRGLLKRLLTKRAEKRTLEQQRVRSYELLSDCLPESRKLLYDNILFPKKQRENRYLLLAQRDLQPVADAEIGIIEEAEPIDEPEPYLEPEHDPLISEFTGV